MNGTLNFQTIGRALPGKGNARSSGYERAGADWYCEPRRAIDALLDVETFDGTVWDPACGGGNIPDACRARGIFARGSDIVQRGGAEAVGDFLKLSRISMPPGGSHAIAKGGSVAFAWFVFDKAHIGSPRLGWLA